MKTNVVCVIAFIALVNGIDEIYAQPTLSKTLHQTRSIKDLQICVPGETKKEDCNNCFCIPSGSGWACTRMECFSMITNTGDTIDQASQDNPLNRVVRDTYFTCDPGSMFKIDCNWCTCTPDGRSATCTLMGCNTGPHPLG